MRRATAQDLPRIYAIEQSCFGPDAWDRDLFRKYLATCPRLFLVALAGRTIVGYSIACVRRNQGEIESIAVAPRHVRRGIGAALIHFSVNALRRAHIRAAALMVETNNHPAIDFYRHLGFRRKRTVRDYYGHGRHGWRMLLSLNP